MIARLQDSLSSLLSVISTMDWRDAIDILLVSYLIYKTIKIARETRAEQLLKGIALLIVAFFAAQIVGLRTVKFILGTIMTSGLVVLVILFQPELRKALEQMGRSMMMMRDKKHSDDSDENSHIIAEIITCLTNLSRRRVGALIVFERKTGLQDVIETGISIDSQISSALLENIFEPNTPLHDGAVVIRGSRVMAAACILTLTEGQGISHELGTRHRAAIGVSETTDAVVLIVSEETGIISMARGGRLTRHLDPKSLREILEGMYDQQRSGLLALLTRKKTKEGEA